MEKLTVGRIANAPQMREQGWKVISVCEDGSNTDKHLPLIDGGGNDPATIREAVGWILEQWRTGQKVFVCCMHGRNRSALIASAALAVSERLWLMQAYARIVAERPIATPRDTTLADVLPVVVAMRQGDPS